MKRYKVKKKTLVITMVILFSLLAITGISGFFGGVEYQGSVNFSFYENKNFKADNRIIQIKN